MAWTQSRVPIKKGVFQMFAIFAPTRETAASLIAACVTAYLFVSAAVGPLPIA